LTQGTTSRIAFTSMRIFLCSFSLPRDILHDVFRSTFCTYFSVLIYFYFLILVLFILFVFVAFWLNLCLCHLLVRGGELECIIMKQLLRSSQEHQCCELLKHRLTKENLCLKQTSWSHFIIMSRHDHL